MPPSVPSPDFEFSASVVGHVVRVSSMTFDSKASAEHLLLALASDGVTISALALTRWSGRCVSTAAATNEVGPDFRQSCVRLCK
jgi:hypothetical protein